MVVKTVEKLIEKLDKEIDNAFEYYNDEGLYYNAENYFKFRNSAVMSAWDMHKSFGISFQIDYMEKMGSFSAQNWKKWLFNGGCYCITGPKRVREGEKKQYYGICVVNWEYGQNKEEQKRIVNRYNDAAIPYIVVTLEDYAKIKEAIRFGDINGRIVNETSRENVVEWKDDEGVGGVKSKKFGDYSGTMIKERIYYKNILVTWVDRNVYGRSWTGDCYLERLITMKCWDVMEGEDEKRREEIVQDEVEGIYEEVRRDGFVLDEVWG